MEWHRCRWNCHMHEGYLVDLLLSQWPSSLSSCWTPPSSRATHMRAPHRGPDSGCESGPLWGARMKFSNAEASVSYHHPALASYTFSSKPLCFFQWNLQKKNKKLESLLNVLLKHFQQKIHFPSLKGRMPSIFRKNCLICMWWKQWREGGTFALLPG